MFPIFFIFPENKKTWKHENVSPKIFLFSRKKKSQLTKNAKPIEMYVPKLFLLNKKKGVGQVSLLPFKMQLERSPCTV